LTFETDLVLFNIMLQYDVNKLARFGLIAEAILGSTT
jgi:hypothetical protein